MTSNHSWNNLKGETIITDGAIGAIFILFYNLSVLKNCFLYPYPYLLFAANKLRNMKHIEKNLA